MDISKINIKQVAFIFAILLLLFGFKLSVEGLLE